MGNITRHTAVAGGALIGAGEVDVAVPEFWAATALGALKFNTVMAQLVRRDFSAEVATVGDTVNVTRRATLVVNDKAPDANVQLQPLANTQVQLTLDRHKEISFLVEDVASAMAIDDALNYVEDAAIAIAEQVDADLLGLESQVTTQAAGAPFASMSVAAIVAARRALNDQKVPLSNRFLVISSEAESDLLAEGTGATLQLGVVNTDFGGEAIAQPAVVEARIGRRYGFDIFMDQQVVVDTVPAPDEEKNLAFHRDAFTLVTRLLPMPPMGSGAVASAVSEDGLAMRAIRAYNPDALGVQFTIDMLYGEDILRVGAGAVGQHAIRVESQVT